MKFGLEQNTIDNLTAVFEQFSKVDEAFIFGSRAKGNYRPDSDIDIAIKGQDIYTDDIIAMSIAFEEKGITHKIDLINYNTINEPALKDHIDRVGIEFFSSWKEYRFSDFVSINPTVSLKGNDEYSFVEMKDLQDGNKICSPSAKRKTSSGARFQERDTLFARITPCLENGKICQVRELENGIGFGSTEFLVFRGKKEVSNNDFVFYLSRWNEVRDFAENNFEGTSGRQRVPKNCFDNLRLKLPPLKEQNAIASTLSSLDAKIDVLHRQNKTLEGLAETLFRQFYVEEAEDEWEKSTIGIELDTVLGGTPSTKKPEYWNGNIPWINSGEVNNFRIIKATKYISELGLKKSNTKLLPKGTTVIAITGATLGQISLLEIDTCANQSVVGIIPSDKFPKEFVFLWVKHKIKEIILNETGGAQPHINKNDINETEIIIPSKEKIEKGINVLNPIFNKITINSHQIIKLSSMRDNLIPKLMGGEIRMTL